MTLLWAKQKIQKLKPSCLFTIRKLTEVGSGPVTLREVKLVSMNTTRLCFLYSQNALNNFGHVFEEFDFSFFTKQNGAHKQNVFPFLLYSTQEGFPLPT